ncbi:MAG: ABC transporter ATP-binding protein, partial [Chitinophagaceae bacterium]
VVNVSKDYTGKKAVDDISFDVSASENFVLIGTSGCGKTTTLRMINRLTELSSGKIFIDGRDAKEGSATELRRNIGYVLQHHGLFPHYTVEENIAVVPLLLGWDKPRIRSRTEELMNKLHLPPDRYLKAYPSELSGGQQQRVGLARALVADPPVILMDEPFGALDDVTRTSIRKEFSELDEFKRKTMVMVTHDVNEAFDLGDRICLMDKGKIVQQGSRFDLLFRPANDFVKDFLKGHRLELQLRVTVMNDILPFIDTIIDARTDQQSDTSMNLWTAMEKLFYSREASDHLLFADPETTGKQKMVMIPDLINAFRKFNQQY